MSEAEIDVRRLRMLLAMICKDHYTIRQADDLFVSNGADASWWKQGDYDESSERMKNCFSWLDSIEEHAPDRANEIVRGVVADILDDEKLDDTARRRLERTLSPSKQGFAAADSPVLDSRITKVSMKLYADGHYHEAVLRACIALIDAVKTKAGYRDKDGSGLMTHVFSPDKPLLRLSDVRAEQQGFMFLFAGAILALRNPRAHNLLEESEDDPERVLEWLTFLSALFRWLDDAVKVNDE